MSAYENVQSGPISHVDSTELSGFAIRVCPPRLSQGGFPGGGIRLSPGTYPTTPFTPPPPIPPVITDPFPGWPASEPEPKKGANPIHVPGPKPQQHPWKYPSSRPGEPDSDCAPRRKKWLDRLVDNLCPGNRHKGTFFCPAMRSFQACGVAHNSKNLRRSGITAAEPGRREKMNAFEAVTEATDRRLLIASINCLTVFGYCDTGSVPDITSLTSIRWG